MTKHPATCTVDDLGGMQYSVEVEGALSCEGHRRIYTVKATSEDRAAMEGLRLFVEEMENLDDAETKDD
ncbi:MAG: hypothetical protein KGL39_48120 [Patescibacteria group bacterium]|nr:hypothetical protein [Patescibacteria group bacterium]